MTSKPRLKASTLSLVVLGALSLQGCATKQAWIPELEAATTTYQEIAQDPVVSALAAEELSLAEFQLQIAETAHEQFKPASVVKHEALVAQLKTLTAQQRARAQSANHKLDLAMGQQTLLSEAAIAAATPPPPAPIFDEPIMAAATPFDSQEDIASQVAALAQQLAALQRRIEQSNLQSQAGISNAQFPQGAVTPADGGSPFTSHLSQAARDPAGLEEEIHQQIALATQAQVNAEPSIAAAQPAKTAINAEPSIAAARPAQTTVYAEPAIAAARPAQTAVNAEPSIPGARPAQTAINAEPAIAAARPAQTTINAEPAIAAARPAQTAINAEPAIAAAHPAQAAVNAEPAIAAAHPAQTAINAEPAVAAAHPAQTAVNAEPPIAAALRAQQERKPLPAAKQLHRELLSMNARSSSQGMALTLGDRYFEGRSARLWTKRAERHLDNVAGFLRNNPQLSLAIEAHTDDEASSEENLDLSIDRATAIKSQLVLKGIDESRIKATGYGETRPIAGNDNPLGRLQNRRVELIFPDVQSTNP